VACYNSSCIAGGDCQEGSVRVESNQNLQYLGILRDRLIGFRVMIMGAVNNYGHKGHPECYECSEKAMSKAFVQCTMKK